MVFHERFQITVGNYIHQNRRIEPLEVCPDELDDMNAIEPPKLLDFVNGAFEVSFRRQIMSL